MRTQLTKRFVADLKPLERPYEVRDDAVRGLILRVQPSGYKAWIVTWAHGKRRTLGPVDRLSLDQARAHAAHALAEATQMGLPSIAKAKPADISLAAFLNEHYVPWAAVELKGGERYAERIRMSFPKLLGVSLTGIDTAVVERWWRDRLGSNVTKATASRDLACLRSALSKAVEWRLLERNPLLGMRQRSVQSQQVVRFLSATEEANLRKALIERNAALVAARASGNKWRIARAKPLLPDLTDKFGDYLTPVVLVAMNTGLRRGELLSLRWSDVNLEARMVTVRAENAKSGKQRHVPVNTEALNALTRWKGQSEGQGRVFPLRDIKTAWTRLLQAAGVAEFRFHDLRHHFASKLVMAGVDLNTVRVLLGHADIAMTLRYAHLAPEHLASAVAKLG